MNPLGGHDAKTQSEMKEKAERGVDHSCLSNNKQNKTSHFISWNECV